MGFEYVNRRGDTYYLLAGKTKTGKPKYYFARKVTAEPADRVPEGYEVYERPENGMVLLRRPRPTPITPSEREQVADGIVRHGGPAHIIVDIEGDSLVVYTASISESEAVDLVGELAGLRLGALTPGAEKHRERLIQRSLYTKMLRFTLVDADRRLFSAERWCFLGSIDNWIFLAGPARLLDLVKKYAKHLGKESFFELM